MQFALVIFLLAFLPNLVLTLTAPPNLPAGALLLWMLVVGALCSMVGYVLSGALLRPLSRLQREVEGGELATHGDDPAEILALRRAFTDLLDRLGTEQMRRNAFMATLVHDLKTPLIAAGHLTQALATLPLPEAERREVGAQMQAETTRLLALVQQMADAHRFEREDVLVQTAPTDLRVLLDGVARRVQPQAEWGGITLSVSGHGHAPADASALERAVTNLTENAIRYARSQVELHVTPQGVVVADDGPGLSASLEQLAQPFTSQATTIAGQQYTAGTAGLGLFIARRIAEAHGGELNYVYYPHRLPPAPSPAVPFLAAPPPPPISLLPTLFTLVLPEVTP
ncbi:sensor histidine kinase [Deinococcus arenicola]|uniref:histidine kinase n=1 Tax=Deinococcus arenicola TaxID=2994950 RepID=A0ABU4DMN8_9DEIO|nr:HAMP domain-containing sensor histidine kinase [Deinococcus sp. ZS9-10]MDV6373364.1 HAMP domain-containing sensor histidine kinase [Deinococcus sp. ZS9-10]